MFCCCLPCAWLYVALQPRVWLAEGEQQARHFPQPFQPEGEVWLRVSTLGVCDVTIGIMFYADVVGLVMLLWSGCLMLSIGV